jgi:hypothetical protein
MLNAFDHPIATLREGLNAIAEGQPEPMPLKETRFDIDVEKGLAIIRTTRVFSNNYGRAIEAIFTFPVPFEGVLTALNAEIDGRKLSAAAKAKSEARDDYEEAVAQGKMAILHEEPLRGLHMLSIGQLAPGKTVRIDTEMVMPLSITSRTPFLKLPLVVGEIYGSSPFLPADDIKSVDGLKLEAILHVTAEHGRILLADGSNLMNGQTIKLDRHLYLQFPDQQFGTRKGIDGWGRDVKLWLANLETTKTALDIAILVDHSGSTGGRLGRGTVHCAIRKGLETIAEELTNNDLLALWEFDDEAHFVGHTRGKDLKTLAKQLSGPNGGTQLGKAVEAVMQKAPKPILVLTDGQTYAHEVETAKKAGFPIHAILVGEGSLDAMIGHLAAQTGGQVISTYQDDVAGALKTALPALRAEQSPLSGAITGGKPSRLKTTRGGIRLESEWSEIETSRKSDAVGRYAASLSLALLDEEAATSLAVTHSLTSHLTSLILIDEAGEAIEGLPQTVKMPVAMASMMSVAPLLMDRLSMAIPSFPVRRYSVESGQSRRHALLDQSFSLPDDWSAVMVDHLDDITALPTPIRLRVEALTQKSEIMALAKSCNLPSATVALILIALRDKDRDRNAGRFVKQAGAFITPDALMKIQAFAIA